MPTKPRVCSLDYEYPFDRFQNQTDARGRAVGNPRWRERAAVVCSSHSVFLQTEELVAAQAAGDRRFLLNQRTPMIRPFRSYAEVLVAVCLMVCTVAPRSFGVDVSLVDLIPVDLRTEFVGFESAPGGHGWPSYSEDGVLVEEIDGTGWARGDAPCGFDIDGLRYWVVGHFAAPGYSRFTRESGNDFVNFGIILGTPACNVDQFKYVLRLEGAVVDSGSVERQAGSTYLGFYGGGFDEVLLRGHASSQGYGFFSNQQHWLAMDAVELSDQLGSVPTAFVLNVDATTHGAGPNAKLSHPLSLGAWSLQRVSPTATPGADFFAWTANRDSPAWRTEIGFQVGSQPEVIAGYCCADSPEDAYAQTPPSESFFRFDAQDGDTLKIWVGDEILWDNGGGASFLLEKASTENLAAVASTDPVPGQLRVVPNPALPRSGVDFSVAGSEATVISVYDAGGRLIRALEAGSDRSGESTLHWDGRDGNGVQLPAGIYYARLGNLPQIGRIVIVK